MLYTTSQSPALCLGGTKAGRWHYLVEIKQVWTRWISGYGGWWQFQVCDNCGFDSEYTMCVLFVFAISSCLV